MREYELCRELEREARRCYEQRCRSNIYTPRRWEPRPRVTCPVSTCVFRWLARQDLDRERIILGVEAGPGTNTTLGDQFYACAVGDIGRYNQCKQEFFQNLDLKLERL